MRTPVFEQLRADMPDAPICRICAAVTLIAGDGDVCSQCWMCDRDTPEGHARWHCADCGEFIDGLERHHIVTEHPLERYEVGGEGFRYDYVYLCREHYGARTARAA